MLRSNRAIALGITVSLLLLPESTHSREDVSKDSGRNDSVAAQDPATTLPPRTHYKGREIQSTEWKIVPYQIPKGNLAAYFPEANALVPLESVAVGSNTPTSKSIEVSIVRRKD